MAQSKLPLLALIPPILAFSFALVFGDCVKGIAQETDPKAFKILKEKMTDPQTGLPKTLDPNLFKGKAKKAYEVAKEIPAVLAQVPCFCECEAYGHNNLLDCFIDNHGAG
jgi:Protein of unknown function with PCYCGC motif